MSSPSRTAVLTGVGRRRGIAAALAVGLAQDGWNLVLPILPSYDERLGIGGGAAEITEAADAARGSGVQVVTIEADLADPQAPSAIFAEADALGQPMALVLAHSESVDSSILTTTVESWIAISPSTPVRRGC